jgi:hypothetical protein
MEPMDQSHIFGGGAAASVMTPFVMILLVLLCVLILSLPRRFVIVPVLSGAFLVWLPAQIYLLGVHWLVFRILILVGLLRVLASSPEGKGKPSRFIGGFTGIDRAFLFWIITQSVCVVLLFPEQGAVINQFGYLVDFLGGYFLIRFLIRNESDLFLAIKCLAVLSVILAASMIVEQLRLTNYLAQLAGVAKSAEIREGKIRSQGVFQHSITAGTVGATWLPLFFLLWRNGKSRILAIVGFIGASIITYTSQSSTPLLAYAAVFVALAFWPIRHKMRTVRWAIVLSIAGLAMVMKAPVWFLIAHIDLTGGSSGYHRAQLIDNFVRHFWDWWLIGVKDTSSWGYDLWDVQNQYVSTGETGGLLAFCFLIVLVTRCFVRLGDARKKIAGDKNQEWLLWFLACALFSNALAFIGVNYFDQSRVSWFLIVAAICAATSPMLEKTAEEPVPQETTGSRLQSGFQSIPNVSKLNLR